MKPRSIETVRLRSLHSRFANVGTEKWATPEEAKLLISLGMAALVTAEPVQTKEYQHREMRATGTRKAR